MKTPNLKRLEIVFGCNAKLAKRTLVHVGESSVAELKSKLRDLNIFAGTHGVKKIALSDASFLYYLDTMDPHTPTLYRYHGDYYVGDVAAFIERKREHAAARSI